MPPIEPVRERLVDQDAHQRGERQLFASSEFPQRELELGRQQATLFGKRLSAIGTHRDLLQRVARKKAGRCGLTTHSDRPCFCAQLQIKGCSKFSSASSTASIATSISPNVFPRSRFSVNSSSRIPSS